MTNELLVVIDPQKDFINRTGFYAKKHLGINQILNVKQKINKLLALYDKERIVIVFSDYEKGQFESGLSICIPDTDGHKIDIEIDSTFTLISKNSHSCFSSDTFKSYLKSNFVHKIILCGFLAEYCVKQTALDGLENGYKICLLKEYIGTGDDVQNRREQMFKELALKGAEVLNEYNYKEVL
jgi:nicotinamidase/pyrazinamidase